MKKTMEWRLSARTLVLGLLGIACVSVASAQTPLVWYKMNEGSGTLVGDSGSGTALNATMSGTATWTTSTPSGTGSAVSIVDNATDANFISTGAVTGTKVDALSQFTITLWVNLQALPTAGDRLISTLNVGATKGFDLNIQNPTSGTLSAANFCPTLMVDGYAAPAVGAPSNNVSAANTWLFLAVTYDGLSSSGNVKFYSGNTSGALISLGTTSITSGAVDSTTGALQIGNTSASSGDRTPSALFDDVRIYGGVLTSTDIDTIRMDAVPEPSTALLAALGLAGFGLLKLRSRRQLL